MEHMDSYGDNSGTIDLKEWKSYFESYIVAEEGGITQAEDA